MNTLRWLQVAVLTTASFLSVGALNPTTAATFDNIELDQNNLIAVAAPYGENKNQLLIIEQISNKQPCWSENGSNPVSVEPLLLNFNFTGICDRKTDSNGYSIRMNGEDMGLQYLIRLVERNGELVLVGTHRTDRKAPEIEIGRTMGLGDGFEKIFLNPGWRFTKRTYQGKTLGHVYLTNDSATPYTQEPNPNPSNPQALPPSPQPLPSDPISEPVRELIFTKPQAGTTPPGVGTPATRPQPLPPAPTQDSGTPVFVVPTTPQQAEPVAPGNTPITSPQTLPPPPSQEPTIPVFVVPAN
jgi:N-acetylmuramoyl-L-alanine amidase